MKVIFDTTYFFGQKFDWKNRKNILLQQLHAEGIIEIYLPEVVDREIINNLTSQAKRTFAVIKKQLDKNPAITASQLPSIEAISNFFRGRGNKTSLVTSVLEEYESFKQSLGISIIPLDCGSCPGIFDDYFSCKPPFEHNEQKKSEFPDAFAVESIKSFFNEEYFVISRDKGWKRALANEEDCTFFDKSGAFFSHIEELLVEAERRVKARDIIEEHFSPVIDLIEERFPSHGFMATDVPDEWVNDVEVNQVDPVDIYIEETDDDYIIFSADITISFTANVSFSAPDSWYKDSDTGEIFYWDKRETDVEREIQIEGRFTYALDPDSGDFEDLIDWETGIPDTVYFEIQEHDYRGTAKVRR